MTKRNTDTHAQNLRDVRPKTPRPGHPSGLICTRLTALLLTVAAAPVLAYTSTTNLGSLGLNENQQRSGDGVQIVCGQFARGDVPVGNALQADLFNECGKMVHNGNELTANGGPTGKSLGLNQPDLMNSVMTVANEELSATKSMAAEMPSAQTDIAVARLQAVRSGARIGFSGDAFEGINGLAGLDGSARGGAAGDDAGNGWGYFINARGGFGDRDRTENENQFDYDSWGFDVGTDYRYNPDLIVGVLLSYESSKVKFGEVATSPTIANLPGGGIDADSWGLGLYGTYYKDNYYVDGLISYARADYDIRREVLLTDANNAANTTRRTATGDTNSNNLNLSVGGGMDLQKDNISYGPYARLSYQNNDIDGYSESGAQGLNLTVDGQDWESLTSVIGGRASMAKSTEWGVIVPQARLGWIHEFLNDSQVFRAFYTNDPVQNSLLAITDNPDRDYFELGLSVSAVMRQGMQVFLDYQTLIDHKYLNDHLFTVGFRGEFQ